MTDFELARQIAAEIREKHQERALPFILEVGKTGLCDSKAGGTPYLPHNMAWPLDSEGQPMILLAQVDCSALESLPDFPHAGLLQFFIGTDDMYGADLDDMTNQKGFSVLYHETVDTSVTEEEVLAKCPAKDEGEDIYTPFEIEEPCRICFTAPKSMGLTDDDFRFGGLFVEEWNRRRPDAPIKDKYEIHQRLKEENPDYDWDVFETEEDDDQDGDYDETDAQDKDYGVENDWDEDDDEEPAHHQMGGYPYFTQQDPRSDEEMADLDVVLFQLDSDFRPESRDYLVCWGDVGVANFFINREALKKRDFSGVAYNWDCC